MIFSNRYTETTTIITAFHNGPIFFGIKANVALEEEKKVHIAITNRTNNNNKKLQSKSCIRCPLRPAASPRWILQTSIGYLHTILFGRYLLLYCCYGRRFSTEIIKKNLRTERMNKCRKKTCRQGFCFVNSNRDQSLMWKKGSPGMIIIVNGYFNSPFWCVVNVARCHHHHHRNQLRNWNILQTQVYYVKWNGDKLMLIKHVFNR